MNAPASRKQRRAAAKAARAGGRANALAKADRFLKVGDLKAAEASYREAHRAAPRRAEPLQGLGRVLRLDGRLQDALEAYESALSRSPEDPGILFELGNLARDMGMQEAAAKFFAAVIALKPDAMEAHNNLGSALRQLGRLDEAVNVLKPAIEQWPDCADLWLTLGNVMADAEENANAENFYMEALRLRPDFGPAVSNLADVLYAEGRQAEAIDHYRRATVLLPDNPSAHFNYSQALLATGDLEQGWDEYEWRLDPAYPKSARREHGLPRWAGEDLTGKRILICAEQGVGDEMRAAHCFPDAIARAGACLIECDPRLQSLFERSFPDATFHPWQGHQVAGKDHRTYEWLADLETVDVAIEAASLPRFFRRDLTDFPGPRKLFAVDPVLAEQWRGRVQALGPGLTVGISWTSGLMDVARARSYAPLSCWQPILSQPGARFVSLQYGDTEAEIAAAEKQFGIEIARWPDLDLKNDFDGIAALVDNLDLVIAPGTAVRQLSAGLDIPTWVMVSEPAVTALGQPVSPYAVCMKYFVRRPDPDMSGVLARVGEELAALVGSRA